MHDKVYESFGFLDIKVHKLTADDLFPIVEQGVFKKEKQVIGYHNLHSVYMFHKSKLMQQFYDRANFVHIDGMPIIWFGKMLGYPLKRENRITSLDWLESFLSSCAENNYCVFFLGGSSGIAEKAVQVFKERITNLKCETHHGYFDIDSNDESEVLEKINSFRPHVVLVGMGMPRQEEWVIRNIDKLDCNVAWCLGAFMDYYAGVVRTPPRWMGGVGVEWLFRFASEPRRMWKRYLLEPWYVVALFLKERTFSILPLILHRRKM